MNDFFIFTGAEMTKGKLSAGENENRCQTTETMTNLNINNDINANHVHEINIAEYVQNLPEDVRNKIAGFFGTGIISEELIDVENIEHYLVVSRHSNPLKSACELKLLSTLDCSNCLLYITIAESYGLASLGVSARQVLLNSQIYTNRQTESPREDTRCKTYKCYRTIFTCDTNCAKRKRVISAVVFNSENEIKCYRNIKKGDKISKQFQCCCIQDDADHPPYVYWSFGKCFRRYDPILNKCKNLASLQYSRSKFSLVAYNQRCYAIGGICQGQTVRQIEEYDTKRKSWTTVCELPPDCQMTYSSCVLFENLIYIFSAATHREHACQNRTIVCVFDPRAKTVSLQADSPMSFNQIKACVVGTKIYLASDNNDFLVYNPVNGSFNKETNQIVKCKDFGMYCENGNVCLVGGINEDGKCNNSIRKFCTESGRWERLSHKLPDCMAVYGTCEVKIPNTCAIVPFYETKLFEIPRK